MSYYKVVDRLNAEVTINTSQSNYSLTLDNKDAYKNIIEVITQSSARLNLPLDFFVSLNNNIALFGNNYFKHLPNPLNEQFELKTLTNNPKHANHFISVNDFISVVQQMDDAGIDLFSEGFYLWEKIYEDVRASKYNDKPGRDDSFFLFDSIQCCEYYIETHKGGGQICEVDLVDTCALFKADMKLLDEIPNNFTYTQATIQADRYWTGEVSARPVFEYLFRGTCKLKPI